MDVHGSTENANETQMHKEESKMAEAQKDMNETQNTTEMQPEMKAKESKTGSFRKHGKTIAITALSVLLAVSVACNIYLGTRVGGRKQAMRENRMEQFQGGADRQQGFGGNGGPGGQMQGGSGNQNGSQKQMPGNGSGQQGQLPPGQNQSGQNQNGQNQGPQGQAPGQDQDKNADNKSDNNDQDSGEDEDDDSSSDNQKKL